MESLIYRPLGDDKDKLVSFLLESTWPFHSTKNPTVDTYTKAYDSGYYHDNNETFWIEHSDQKIGLIIIEDINDGIPLFDLRLASQVRGKGYGKKAVNWMTDYIFNLPKRKVRIEAHTRVDNLAMRKTFNSCGYVKEGYFRDAWENDDGSIYDCVCYAIIRKDWENNKTTPIRLDDYPF